MGHLVWKLFFKALYGNQIVLCDQQGVGFKHPMNLKLEG